MRWLYSGLMASLSFFSLLFLLGRSQLTCHNESQCYGNEIVSASDIECFGYQSCAQAIKIESTSSAYIYCDGSYSCHASSLIHHTNDDQGHIYCDALYSCAFATNIVNDNGAIFCDGESSCRHTNIVVSSYARCYGWKSCADSNITASGRFDFSGGLSAQNSFITAGDDSVDFDFYGFNAGFGATLVCQTICNLNCHAGGCNNLTLTCADDGVEGPLSGSCDYTITCEESVKSDVCPDGYQLTQFPSLASTEMSTYENSFLACNTSSHAVVCANYQDSECYKSQQTGPICCLGKESCSSISSISSVSNIIYETAFRADGVASACNTDTINVTGNVFISRGDGSSCDTLITSSSGYDVIGTGFNSLRYRTVRNVGHVFCLGHTSCWQANIENVYGNIYGYAYYSMSAATMKNIAGSIYCGSYWSCVFTIVYNVSGDVIGVGTQVLWYSRIYGVNNVVAKGKNCMLSISIEDANTITAEGESSLQGSSIRGIRRLKVSGASALNAARVVSEAPSNLMVALIDGANSAAFDVYCNTSDICQIVCQSPLACSLMRLHCFGVCQIDCDETKGIACPASVSSGNEWSHFNWSTENPTLYPSIDPTAVPSTDYPTLLPSSSPSEDIMFSTSKQPRLPTVGSADFVTQTNVTTTISSTKDSRDEGKVDWTMIIVVGSISLFLSVILCIIYCIKWCQKRQHQDVTTAVTIEKKANLAHRPAPKFEVKYNFENSASNASDQSYTGDEDSEELYESIQIVETETDIAIESEGFTGKSACDTQTSKKATAKTTSSVKRKRKKMSGTGSSQANMDDDDDSHDAEELFEPVTEVTSEGPQGNDAVVGYTTVTTRAKEGED